MKNLRFKVILGLILMAIITGHGAWGKGLSVSPASYTWINVNVGIPVRCPSSIMIRNESNEPRSYTLRALRPDEANIKVSDGFKELPSKKWISFNRKRISINPGEWVEVRMSIVIPLQQENFDQKWDFIVEVKEYSTGAEMFTLAAYPRFSLITEGRGTTK